MFFRIKFKDPQYEDNYVFKAVILSGAKYVQILILIINYEFEQAGHPFLLPLFVNLFASRIPQKVLKPGDWERSNHQPWRPQLGFNPNRQQMHLDQSAFRTLG